MEGATEMTAKKTYTLIASSSVWNTDPNYKFESEHPANSKKWCAEVKEIEKQTGIKYNWYTAHRSYAERKAITSWRFNWDK